jgi:hypothetical protein
MCGGLTAARGLTTLELAMVLLVMSLTVGLGGVVATTAVSRATSADNTRQMALMAAQTQRFIIANNRLPCPDTSGDGQENCATPATPQLGQFPFRTLGLGAAITDASGEPIFYAANPALQAPPNVSLASWDYPSGALDRFCQALRQRLGQGFVTDDLAVAPLGGGSCGASNGAFNPAVVFVSAGAADADGSSDRFDGLNRTAVRHGGLCVENPGRAQSGRYDDQVRALGLSALNGLMCLQGRDVFADGLNSSGAN